MATYAPRNQASDLQNQGPSTLPPPHPPTATRYKGQTPMQGKAGNQK